MIKFLKNLQGFEALIDSNLEYPLMSGDKILIRPGHKVGQIQHIVQFNALLFIE